MAAIHWLQLALTAGLGPVLIRRLVEAAGGAEAATAAGETLLRGVEGIGPGRASRIAPALRAARDAAARQADAAARLGVALLCPDDPAYPTLLAEIDDAPPILFVRGRIEPRDLNAVAVVGSRRCSHYGREQAERFAAGLAASGVTIVSGGARGVDSAAHRGALRHPHGRTLAVLGCGVDIVYPPENQELFSQIAARGALLSEFPIGAGPAPENFPRRNRIISGLSRGVLIVEGDERSGAMITARLAGDDHGRGVFALPGRVDNPMARGPHLLIRDGATLVASPADLLEALDPLPDSVDRPTGAGLFDAAADPPALPEEPAEPFAVIGELQRRILDAIDAEECPIERIIERSGLEAAVVVREITFLSIKGLVRRVGGQVYARRRNPA